MCTRFFKIVFSVLTTVIVAVLAAGTIVEKFHGNEIATTHIYGAWWFFLLMACVAATAAAGIADELKATKNGPRKPNIAKLAILASVILILTGGALTAWTGQHGSITLHPAADTSQNTAKNSYVTDKGKTTPLPFEIRLNSFEVLHYPGTQTPMDFVSHVNIDGSDFDISMNNILKYHGFRFYQEDYGDDGSSTLSVAHDPWGIGFTYAGYLLLFVGIVLLFVSRNIRFRKLLKGSASAALLIVAALQLASPNSATAAPRTLPRSAADKMGQLHVLYKGRVCPLQTMAKDYVTKLTGSARYQGLSPEQVFSGWLFYFPDWADEPMIKVKGDDVRQTLGIDGKHASFNDFMVHREHFESNRPSMAAMNTMGSSGERKTMSKTMRAASEKFSLLQMLLGGKQVKIYPVKDSCSQVKWYAQNDDLPLDISNDEYLFIRKQLSYCQELVVTGNFDELEKVFDKTLQYQQKNAARLLPSKARYNAERLYNHLTTGKWLYMLVITLGLLAFAFSLLLNHGSPSHRLCSLLSAWLVALLTLFLVAIFVLRWTAGGHIPMTGGFDSMNLMAMVIGILGVAIAQRNSIVPPMALLTMGFCLLVAMMSGSNPPVTNLMPVLNSPLLTLHVTVIMISYALFFFVMMGGVAGLISRSRADELMRTNLLLLYPAVSLLAIGIVIGALWANISWGNYWSWDPKEVWALITLIVYLYPLLMLNNWLPAPPQPANSRKTTLFHLYCLMAFFSVIVTYFGVNLILGGIHAYN